MGKQTICIGEKKGADQRLCFHYTDSPLLSKSKIFQPLTIFCNYTARFVSDLVRTQIVGLLMHRLIYETSHGTEQTVGGVQ